MSKAQDDAEVKEGGTAMVDNPLVTVTKSSSTYDDAADMHRLGKKQEFTVSDTASRMHGHLYNAQRNFRYLSMTAFTVIAQGGWVYAPK